MSYYPYAEQTDASRSVVLVSRDVTAEARYNSGNESVCLINEDGLARLHTKGEATLSIRYGHLMALSNLVRNKRIDSFEGIHQILSHKEFYKEIGDNLKQHFPGWTVFLLSADPELPKRIGLQTTRRIPLYNGPLECRLVEYRLVAGSNRKV